MSRLRNARPVPSPWLIGRGTPLRSVFLNTFSARILPRFRPIGRLCLSLGTEIIESVPDDTFWSCRLPAREVVNTFPAQWPGYNIMGRLHMMLRSELLDTGANVFGSVRSYSSRACSLAPYQKGSFAFGRVEFFASRKDPVTAQLFKKACRHDRVPCPP